MDNILKLRIQLRRDTVANWVKYDPILLSGETAISSDLNQIKIGDGISKWSELEYVSGDGLVGFTQAEAGSYPVKQADGTLKWVLPSALTAEGIQTEITNIKTILNNVPKGIVIGDTSLEANEDGTVEIPLATAAKCGLVKGSKEIEVSEDGSLNIKQVDVSKLSQEDNLILYGGDALTN